MVPTLSMLLLGVTRLHLPPQTSFEGSCKYLLLLLNAIKSLQKQQQSIPLAALTAVVGLYYRISLPFP